MKNIVISIIMLSSLASCHIYRNYECPDNLSVSDSLFRHPVAEEDTMTIASVSWRELFTDPKLQELIECGLENNTDLRIAFLKVNEAEASLMSSKLSFLPSLGLSADASISSLGGESATETYSVGASASWEIDIFGKLRNAKKGTEALLYQYEANARAVQTLLIATIADSYYTLLALDEQLKTSQETSKNWSSYVKTLVALKDNGTVKESDIAQAKANSIKVDASLVSLEQQITSVENSLSVLLGRVPGAIERSTLDEQVFPDSLSVGVPLQLLRNRPDVMQAEWKLAEAYYTTNQARAAFYPSITLGGNAGWTNSGGGTITDPASWLLSAVGSLVQPLFENGKNIANLKIAKAQQEESLLSFQQSILNAGAEVNDALVAWQASRKRIDMGKQQIEALESAVKSTELLMKYGNVNYLEVLVAQQALLEAQMTNIGDKYNEIKGVIDLYHALGGGIK